MTAFLLAAALVATLSGRGVTVRSRGANQPSHAGLETGPGQAPPQLGTSPTRDVVAAMT